MTDQCPCGQGLKEKTEMDVRLREEVDVRYCLCGRIKYVVVYGKFDKCNTAHDKFKVLAGEL